MTPGTQLGPYRVESLIGAGGMGEVYLGVDTRLDRQVAIKILSTQFASDPALRERFEREARTISSLSHPNICTLFDLGQHQGSDYLVMEYLQGETLADRIARGHLPADQVIRIGLGIAQALEAAHRQGVIHRDLKPGNVMLTRSGVKLLDFGLARVGVSSGDSAPDATTMMATAQKPLTEQGAILGTFQYMAPEQLEGRPADARTDIFALGAILYEMATGRRAFQGSTKASLIAAIIDREPPAMTEIQPLTPPALERVVRACLAKEPEERIQTAHDVALQLKWISESSTAAEAVPHRRRRRQLPWIVAAALATALASVSALWWRERTKPVPPFSMSIVPPSGHDTAGSAISPDGKVLAFLADRRESGQTSLWIRRLDDGTERQLVAEAEGLRPFWSPDGQWVGYFAPPDQIRRVRVDGGPPETIVRTPMQGAGAWSEDGTILFGTTWGSGLSSAPASGGEPKVVTRVDRSRRESVHLQPQFLPGSRRFLYTVHTTSEKRNEIWASSLDGEKPRQVATADALIGYHEPYLLIARDGAVYAQRFDADELRTSGEPQRVLDQVAFFESEAAAAATVSRTGVLAYSRYHESRALMNIYERNGVVAATLWADAEIALPSLSRDEKTLVVSKFDFTKGATDLYAIDLERRISTRLTRGLAAYRNPRISPDGQSVAYHSDRGGLYDVYVQSIDGATPARAVWADDVDKWVLDWSPDGTQLLSGRFDPKSGWDLWIVSVNGAKPWPLLATETNEMSATFSPDGKWVAYVSATTESDAELFLRPFPKGRALRVSTDGGGVAAWSRDGRELVWASKSRVLAASVDLSGPTPVIGAPRELFRLPRIWSWPIVMKDGRIAVIVPAPDADLSTSYHITNAWQTKLK